MGVWQNLQQGLQGASASSDRDRRALKIRLMGAKKMVRINGQKRESVKNSFEGTHSSGQSTDTNVTTQSPEAADEWNSQQA